MIEDSGEANSVKKVISPEVKSRGRGRARKLQTVAEVTTMLVESPNKGVKPEVDTPKASTETPAQKVNRRNTKGMTKENLNDSVKDVIKKSTRGAKQIDTKEVEEASESQNVHSRKRSRAVET